MTKIFKTALLIFLLFIANSQYSFAQCFQIESILVAACSPPGPTTEGYNEMVRFKIGPTPVNTSTLVVNWPSNTWQGLIQNAVTSSKVLALNAAIDLAGGCGNLLEPTGGVLPANASVILVTSQLMDINSNSFGALSEDTYIIFQNNLLETGGHFGNYNPTPGLRTLTMTFGGSCSDTVTYQRASLTNGIGDTVLFTPSGIPSYVNFGCVAPVPPFTVDAGSSPVTACPGSTVALAGTAVGHQSVAWSAASGTFSSITTLSTNYTIPSNAGGQSITLTLTATNSCGISINDTVIVEVINAPATITDFTYPTPNCVGSAPISPTTAPGFTTGGTFTSNANLNIDSLTGLINVAASTSGYHTILYSVTADPATCRQASSSTFTIQITNSGAPIVEFSYPSGIVCNNSAPINPVLAAGFVSGGTFTSDSGLSINPTTGVIDISTSTVASHTIVYSVPGNPASCQAAGSDFFTIQIVNPSVPVTGFSYTTPVCTTSGSLTPIIAPGFVGGGTYTSDAGLSINPTTGVINVTTSTAGSHTVTYTIPADLPNCNQGGNSTFTIQINSATTPITDFTYTTPICGSSSSISPIPGAGFTTGGNFTSDAGLNINPTTGVINVAASTAGSHIVTYTINPSSCNTGGSDAFTIFITAAITPVTDFSYPTTICSDSIPLNPTPSTGFTSGGIYSSDPGLVINATTGEINVSASTTGSHTIIYTINPDAASCNNGGSSTFTIIINSAFIPVTDFSYTTPVCGNSTPINLIPAAGFVTGGNYSSDAGLSINATTGVINVASSTTGSHTITYTINPDPATCNNGGSDTFTIFITPIVTPVTDFSYPTPVCSNSSPLNPTLAPGFTGGGIYSSDAGLSINASTGIINVGVSTTGSHLITYTINPDPATCNVGASDTFTIVINPTFTPVTGFTYPTPICPNSPPVNPILASGFTGGGSYTSDAGLTINPVTGQINASTSTVGSHTITYTITPNAATCNLGNSNSFTISIDPASAIAPTTGSSMVCVGETIQLSNPTPGGTWSSSDPNVATVDSTGLVTGVSSNYVNIFYTVNNVCTVAAISNITVYAVPNPLLEDKYLCVSNISGEPYNSVLLECGVTNANHTFVWTLDGAVLPTTTNAHLASGLGVYEVTVTNTLSGCVNTTSCTVSASSTAIASASVSEDFDQNQIITVEVTGGSGDYLFQLDHGVPQESNIFPYAYQGEYTITIIDKNGCQDAQLTVFAINYPRFFTPNGDGYNDTWGIKGLTDLNARGYIYDRSGKLVKSLEATGEEWDGTLNGTQLPSTDYWFQLFYVNRDGVSKEFKSHFSLKR